MSGREVALGLVLVALTACASGRPCSTLEEPMAARLVTLSFPPPKRCQLARNSTIEKNRKTCFLGVDMPDGFGG